MIVLWLLLMSSVWRHFYVGIPTVHARLCIVHLFTATLHLGRDLMKNFALISVTQFTCGKSVRFILFICHHNDHVVGPILRTHK